MNLVIGVREVMPMPLTSSFLSNPLSKEMTEFLAEPLDWLETRTPAHWRLGKPQERHLFLVIPAAVYGDDNYSNPSACCIHGNRSRRPSASCL